MTPFIPTGALGGHADAHPRRRPLKAWTYRGEEPELGFEFG